MLGMALLGTSGAAIAQYRPMPLAGGGYSSKQVSEARWKVRGFSPGGPEHLARHVALYRAAIVAKRAGFDHFVIVDSWLQSARGRLFSSQNVELTVVGTNSPEVPVTCEAKKEWVRNCRVMDVKSVLQDSGAFLGRDSAADLLADPPA